MNNDGSVPGMCRFAARCRTPGGGTDLGRGLCWACERHAEHTIGRLADDHRALCARIPKDAGRRGLGGAAGRPGPQTPVHLEFDAMARRIVWSLGTWEQPVRETANLSPVWERGVRDVVVAQRATRILTRHFSVLLALPDTAYLPYESPVADSCDGPAAVVDLVGLHHRAVSLLGENRRWEPRALPCPAPPAGTDPDQTRLWGCGLYHLGRWVGDDRVWCGNCGWSCTADEYGWYTTTWRPPVAAVAG